MRIQQAQALGATEWRSRNGHVRYYINTWPEIVGFDRATQRLNGLTRLSKAETNRLLCTFEVYVDGASGQVVVQHGDLSSGELRRQGIGGAEVRAAVEAALAAVELPAAPVAEAPVAEAPVAEAPVAEAPRPTFGMTRENIAGAHALALAEERRMVRASCGHRVLPALVMQASRGSACEDCYDRMS